VTDDVRKLYEDSVVVELVTLSAGSHKPHSRHSRSVPAAAKARDDVS